MLEEMFLYIQLNDDNRTYFCSSLVSKCYKEAGILQTSIPSSAYFPSHFSEDGNGIGFMMGSYLAKEQKINFDFADGKSNCCSIL